MRLILITNDDGISAGGMRRLAEQAVKHGEVWIVAPDSQRSAASHCITLHRHVDVFPVEYPVEGVKAFSCTGSPADCVRLGCLYLLPRKPDVVLSGINHGWNVATDIQYSATAGAAFEAAFQDVPAIAFSEAAVDLHEAADRYFPEILSELLAREDLKTLPQDRILNVNFPGCPLKECRGVMRDVTVSGGRVFRDHYVLQKSLRDGGMRLEVEGVPDKQAEEGTDLWAVTHGCASVGTVKNIS